MVMVPKPYNKGFKFNHKIRVFVQPLNHELSTEVEKGHRPFAFYRYQKGPDMSFCVVGNEGQKTECNEMEKVKWDAINSIELKDNETKAVVANLEENDFETTKCLKNEKQFNASDSGYKSNVSAEFHGNLYTQIELENNSNRELFNDSCEMKDIEKLKKPLSESKHSSRAGSVCSTVSYERSTLSTLNDFCRICHCETDPELGPLISPCYCSGSLRFVHQSCLQQWIKSSDSKHCELCGYPFVMDSKLKPFRKWEKLSMTKSERRKIICSVLFHVIAITCVVWSLYVLIERTTEEIRTGELHWPFWTKLVVVAIGITGGLVFMYVQCKVYVLLWRRLKAYNRVIYVQNHAKESSACKRTENVNAVLYSTTERQCSSTQPITRSHSIVIVDVCRNQNGP